MVNFCLLVFYLSFFIVTSPFLLAQEKEAEWFVIGRTGEPKSVHPYFQHVPTYETFLFHSPLTYFSPQTGEWECGWCETVPKIAKRTAASGETVHFAEFKIRSGLRWNDDSPITAKDVEFSWKVLKRFMLKFEAPLSAVYQIRDIKTGDDSSSFEIIFAGESVEFPFLDNFFLLRASLEEDIFERFPNSFSGYLEQSLYTTQPQRLGLFMHPVRSVRREGNRTFITWQKDKNNHIRSFQTVLFYHRTSEELRWSFRNRIVQMIPEDEFGVDSWSVFQKEMLEKKIEYYAYKFDSPMHVGLAFNFLNSSLLRSSIRLGLGCLTMEVVDEFAKGIDSNLTYPVQLYGNGGKYNSHDYCKKGLIPFLLGDRRGKDARVLNLEIVVSEDINAWGTVVERLRQRAAEHKISLVPVVRNLAGSGKFRSARAKAFQDLLLGLFQIDRRVAPLPLFSSGQIPKAYNDYVGQNAMAYRNSSVDKLLGRIVLEESSAKKEQLLNDLDALLLEDAPVFFTHRLDQKLVSRIPILINEKNLSYYPSSFWLSGWLIAR